ncbi:MAG: sulfatase-like hydrolase/transferase [Planctomycetota bacterium]
MISNFLRAALPWTLLPLAVACSAKEPAAPAGPPWNVVLLCLDTVRADHLGVYGHTRATTPALDALAARATLFIDTSATAGWTKPSVPSFLTGTYPSQHGVFEGSARNEAGEVTDLLPASATTLAEVFQQRGFDTAAFVHNAQLRAGNGFEQGFDTYAQESMDAREIRWHGLDWLDGRTSTDPFFLYLHFLDAHWPYPAPEEFLTRFAPSEATARFRGKDSKALYSAINDGEHLMTAEDRAALEALYDGALAYLDSELGKLFAGLEQRGLGANTIVCVVADHGEEFGEHGKVGHGHGLWQNLLHVPWILFVPGKAAQRVETPVSLVDLFPTLLSAAGVPAPATHEGIDRLADPRTARAILAEHKAPDRYFQSLRVGAEKLQRRFTPPKTTASEVKELPVQPGTRWQIEFALGDGQRLATELQPDDGAIDDEPELKGRLTKLTDKDFEIAGVRITYDEDTKRQTGAGTAGPELAEGLVVKVRGKLEDGALATDRIKFYPPSDKGDSELRATVESIRFADGSGEVTLGGLTLALTPATDLGAAAPRAKKRALARPEIAEFLAAGAADFAAEHGYEVVRTAYDLAQDAEELAPAPFERGTARDAELDRLLQTLVQKKLFGTGDQRLLDAEAVQDLRDIGYGGE